MSSDLACLSRMSQRWRSNSTRRFSTMEHVLRPVRCIDAILTTRTSGSKLINDGNVLPADAVEQTLDASGGGLFRNLIGPALLHWNRAAASTSQTFGCTIVRLWGFDEIPSWIVHVAVFRSGSARSVQSSRINLHRSAGQTNIRRKDSR